MKIKTDKVDVVFSKVVRARDRFCVRCGRSDGRLECSHIFSRRHLATRWDLRNAKLLCFACHRWWHENPVESGVWIREYLGDEVVEEVRRKAMAPTKMKPWEKEEIYQDLVGCLRNLID